MVSDFSGYSLGKFRPTVCGGTGNGSKPPNTALSIAQIVYIIPHKNASGAENAGSIHAISTKKTPSGVFLYSFQDWRLHLYFDVDSGRKGEIRQRFNNLLRGRIDINQPLVNSHFELLT